MTPYRAEAPCDWQAILTLIQDSFAFMDDRIDPPSSMHRLSPADIARQAREGEVWVIGHPPVACVFLTVKPGVLYIGKLAVAKGHRGKGLARALIDMAETRARSLGLAALELQTRVELTENHATFRALGFTETGRTAHEGYARPTSLTFSRRILREGSP